MSVSIIIKNATATNTVTLGDIPNGQPFYGTMQPHRQNELLLKASADTVMSLDDPAGRQWSAMPQSFEIQHYRPVKLEVTVVE